LKQLSDLSFLEWRLLADAVILLPLVALQLRLLGFLRTKSVLARFSRAASTTHFKKNQRARDVELLVRMVNVGARFGIYRANCLKIPLVLWYLLRRWGLEAKVRLGVQRIEDCFYAHSWVELDGKAVIGGADAQKQFCAIF